MTLSIDAFVEKLAEDGVIVDAVLSNDTRQEKVGLVWFVFLRRCRV